MASASAERTVTGKHGIVIGADALLAEVASDSFDALLLPGGPAVRALREAGAVAQVAKEFGMAGKLVAAICAAPLLLKDAGLLEGRRHTAHFTTFGELPRAEGDQRVVVDGTLITSRGAGTAVEFGLAVAAYLVGDEAAREVAAAIMA
jgi:4-methyl-5(b-hydroxyethyl)-thiazole monophosphate biosynthesis